MKVRPLFFARMLLRIAGFASGVSREFRPVSKQDYPHEAPGAVPQYSQNASQKLSGAESLQGLAKWQGQKLVFTDPNGSRPYTAAELGPVWREDLPEHFVTLPGKGQMQREAFVDWVSDDEDFRETNSTDRWSDLQRIHARLVNETTPERLYRGMSMSPTVLAEFIGGLRRCARLMAKPLASR